MKMPTHDVTIDIATCPSCKRTITARAVVQVKIEQPPKNEMFIRNGIGGGHPNTQPSNQSTITVTATPTIVGLDINHFCGRAVRDAAEL